MEKSFLEYNLVHTDAGLCHQAWFTTLLHQFYLGIGCFSE